MSSYYNENDPYAAQWLRNLIAAGHIPAGEVDDRSIVDVRAADLAGFDQCHFFAGIGGWPFALALAGWTADRPVWTGSAPCQPFSSAGKQSGAADERHLWPAWLRLIRECRPDAILGEQVEGAVGFGWIDRVFADLEAEGYACGAAVLGAHSVGAPHIRQRLFWVADTAGHGCGARPGAERCTKSGPALAHNGSATGGLADAAEPGTGRRGVQRSGEGHGPLGQGASAQPVGSIVAGGWMGHADAARSQGRRLNAGERADQRAAGAAGDAGGLGNANGAGRAPPDRLGIGGDARSAQSPHSGFWDSAVWLPCLDGKARRAQPGIFPLVAGLPLALDGLGPISRVGALRGAGNAITPQAAAVFVSAFMEARG